MDPAFGECQTGLLDPGLFLLFDFQVWDGGVPIRPFIENLHRVSATAAGVLQQVFVFIALQGVSHRPRS